MSLMQQCLDCISAIGASTAEWREILGVRHWLQAPVLPEPQGFSLPSSKRKGCGRRLPRADADLAVGVVGAQQRLPRSFLSPVPVLPTSANTNRRGSLCADHSPVVFLLCHKSSLILMNRALQQGHRGKLLASAAANRMRLVA